MHQLTLVALAFLVHCHKQMLMGYTVLTSECVYIIA